ncbi:Heparin-sulfate lyase [subsurface metagenome]|nr:hypothetical protein [Clostridia bacterium]
MNLKISSEKYLKYSPKMIVEKVFYKAKNKSLGIIGKIFVNLFGVEMTDIEFLNKAWSLKYKFQNAEELRKYFYKRKEPKFFINSSKQKEIITAIKERFPTDLERIIAKADKIQQHVFNLLGSGDVSLGTKIDWHCDFKTGYCWNPRKYYKDIEIPYGKGDIKVPWELSRFQHLSVLGQAYWLTGDEKYAREFVGQVSDWIDDNKSKFGVNWRCTMDVAMRVCNWILGYYYFKDSPEITDEFLLKFLKSLYQHGRHIMSNLEWSETLTSNHYLSDIVGLLYLGVLFPEFKEVKKWREFGIKGPIKEMEKQVYPDGCDFEASTCYHRLVLELFFFSTLLVVINDSGFSGENYREITEKVFGKKYTERFYKMFEAVLYLLKPDGRMPQFGDNDSSRLHIFAKREVLDMRYLITLGAIFFKEPNFKIKELGFCEEALWIFGKKGYKIWQDLPENCLTNISSKAFPDTGWYIMRKNKDYMIISCGPNGQGGNGGHAHNDKLSFELSVGGKDILLDPGTYVYTPIPYWRNKFRSTLFHNTVAVDDIEQNRFNDKSLFFLKNDAKCRINLWKTTERYDFLDAEHYGYKRLKNPVIHRRQIFYDKNEDYWIVRDLLNGEGKHKFDWCFHIAKNIIFDIDENSLTVTINSSINDEKNIRLKIIPLDIDGFKFFKFNSWLSYGYGRKVSSIMLGYSKTTDIPTDFLFFITTKKFNYSKDDVVNLLESYSK